MAKRKRGGQPGNKNAKGHRGANRHSPGARTATARQAQARAVSRGKRVRSPLGTRIRGTVRGEIQYIKRNRRKFAKAALKESAISAALVAGTTGGIYIAARRLSS